MTFGPFPSDQCWHIEKSDAYQKNQHKVKISEFLLIKGKTIQIVEAKSSSPHPANREGFDKFIQDIQAIMLSSFFLFLGVRLGRHEKNHALDALSAAYKDINLGTVQFIFILVINGHKDPWLSPLRDALADGLRDRLRPFGPPQSEIIVLNEELARNHQLIQ